MNASKNPLQNMSPAQFSSLDAGKQQQAKDIGASIVSDQKELNQLDKNSKDFVTQSDSLRSKIKDNKNRLRNVIGGDTDLKNFISSFVDNSFSNMVPIDSDDFNGSGPSDNGNQTGASPQDSSNGFNAPLFSNRNVRRDLMPSTDAMKSKIANFAKMSPQDDEATARSLLDTARCNENEKQSAMTIRINFKSYVYAALQFELKSDFTSVEYQQARDAAFSSMDSFKDLMRNLAAGAVDLDSGSDSARDCKMFMLSSLASMLSLIQ